MTGTFTAAGRRCCSQRSLMGPEGLRKPPGSGESGTTRFKNIMENTIIQKPFTKEEKQKILTHHKIEYEKATRVTSNRIHLRAYGDMGKMVSNRTYCLMPAKVFYKRGRQPRYYEVTEFPALVTCKKCIKKMRAMGGKYNG